MPEIKEDEMQLFLRASESYDINIELPPDLPEVMLLRFRSKLSLRAIAKILKISHEAVRSRLQKGLKILKGLEMQDIKPLVDS